MNVKLDRNLGTALLLELGLDAKKPEKYLAGMVIDVSAEVKKSLAQRKLVSDSGDDAPAIKAIPNEDKSIKGVK